MMKESKIEHQAASHVHLVPLTRPVLGNVDCFLKNDAVSDAAHVALD